MRKQVLIFLLVLVVPIAYAFVLLFVFSIRTWKDFFDMMSLTFLLSLPAIVGLLSVYVLPREKAQKWTYRIMLPWLPLFVLMGITLAFSIEGWACWLIVLPLFMIAASLGGIWGGHLKTRTRQKSGRAYISLAALLPLLIAPAESLISRIPGTYEAYTSIDIYSSADKIWSNVTRVREIPEAQDKGWLTQLLGFPRPVRAELNYEGVGAYREAVFTNGLVFHETVLEYQEAEKMVFSIKADPYDIPSTTLDEHVVIGGSYFDVLNGTYELEKRSENHYRLHLYSHFKLTTTFNFYASWWARWIMQDIQNNILQVVKSRAEGA